MPFHIWPCYSLSNVIVHRSYTTYCNIKAFVIRVSIFVKSWTHELYSSGILFRLFILISGYVHPNLGPDPHEQDTSVNTSTSSYAHILSSGLSIMYLNIQSLRPKLDILEVEAQLYDILIFTETWLSARVQSNDLDIPNYSLHFRCDREGKLGGGVAYNFRS